jgi:hypothetical protein
MLVANQIARLEATKIIQDILHDVAEKGLTQEEIIASKGSCLRLVGVKPGGHRLSNDSNW